MAFSDYLFCWRMAAMPAAAIHAASMVSAHSDGVGVIGQQRRRRQDSRSSVDNMGQPTPTAKT